MSRTNWNGTFDGLTDWEKTIAYAAFECGYDKGRESMAGGRLMLTVEQERLFTEVIRKRMAASNAVHSDAGTPTPASPKMKVAEEPAVNDSGDGARGGSR